MKNLETTIINLLRKANYSNNERVDQFLVNLALYMPLGAMPEKVQEKYTKKAGIENTIMTNYSAGLGLALGTTKLILVDKMDDYVLTEFMGTPTRAFAMFTMTEATTGLSYASIKNKPLGTIILEGYSRAKNKLKR